MNYKVVAVLWNDHLGVHRGEIPKNPDATLLNPTLTIGALIRKTRNSITILSELEHYGDRDEGSYVIILKSTVIQIKEYGEIELEIKFAP